MIVWEGASPIDGSPIVGIVTGVKRKSANVKTSAMAQLFILRQDITPIEAVKTGGDAAICGACPMRGLMGKGRACYVRYHQSPQSVHRAYVRGSYPRVCPSDASDILAGRKVRLGAYGDPAMLPLTAVAPLVSQSAGWTGYTHQWRDVDPQWSNIVMASADNGQDRIAARATGYRSFYVAPLGGDVTPGRGIVECAATRSRNPLTCDACLMCGGTRNGTVSNAPDVGVFAHGTGAKYVGSPALASV